MNPAHVAGSGNIYASEILFDAKILPTHRANRLKMRDVPLFIDPSIAYIETRSKMPGTRFAIFMKRDDIRFNSRRWLRIRNSLP